MPRIHKLEYDEEYGYYVEDTPKKSAKFNRVWSSHERLTGNAYATLSRPLDRYLRSNIGRPWNDVYSEICERANNSNKIEKFKLFYVLEGKVNTNDVQMIDGVPHNIRAYHGIIFDIWNEFYVHPDTGILCYDRKPKKLIRVKSAHNKNEKIVEGVKFTLQNNSYKRRIDSGVFEVVDDFVWMKMVKYTYKDTEQYRVQKFGHHTSYCKVDGKWGSHYIEGWYTDYQYREVEKVGEKKVVASKKEIRHYKLNETI